MTTKEKPQPKSRSNKRPPTNKTKLQTCLTLLKRKNGATLADLARATGWQAHSVRGFLSGTIKKKLGHNLVSKKTADKTRRYHVEA